jgi:hypothetical protein
MAQPPLRRPRPQRGLEWGVLLEFRQSARRPRGPQDPDPRRGALIGLAIVILLILGGLVLTHVLRKTAQLQDCVMSGRTNCAPIETPSTRN